MSHVDIIQSDRPSAFNTAASMPFGETSPTQISSAWRSTYSLHHVATFLLRREPAGCGDRSSARLARQAASKSQGNSLSGGMPCGITWITGRPLAMARRSASRSWALVKVEIRGGGAEAQASLPAPSRGRGRQHGLPAPLREHRAHGPGRCAVPHRRGFGEVLEEHPPLQQ